MNTILENATVELEDAPCPMGCAHNDEPVLTGRDRIGDLPGTFDVVRCRGCGLLRTSPRPTSKTIGFYYPPDYGPYVGTRLGEAVGVSSGIRRSAVAFAKRLFDTRAHSIPPMPPGRMLEIGCASGSYLDKMAKQGWTVEGIEFSPHAAASAGALGFPVETGAIETIEKADASYDLIVGWMVLEHLHDPVGSLRKLGRWIKPGGVLAISVPDAGAADFGLFGARWYGLHLPNHLFHFQRDTLRKLLDVAGWRMTRIVHHRNISITIASAGYWAQDRGYPKIGQRMIDFAERGGRLGALLAFPISIAMAAAGQTGRMTVWAERKQG